MPCYSYTNNASILASNIESVYTVTTSTTNFSFASLNWICEFPVATQLQIYTRAGVGQTETLKILNTDYTVNTSTNNIVFTTPVASGQVVVRRVTPSDKMLYIFQDGAKLSASQLNGAFHQLLFTVQEKELNNATVNYNYSIATAVAAYAAGTTYSIGQIVSYNSVLYKSKTNSNTGNTPPNATHWEVISPVNAGFVITGRNEPVPINLTSLVPNSALKWTGTQFEASTEVGSLNDLADVTINSLANNNLIRYNNATSQWVNFAPSLDISQTNLLLADRAFYDNNTSTSYSYGEAALTAPASLNIFKNASSKWVLTDAPTVHHIVAKLLPLSGAQTPTQWFTEVEEVINSSAVGSPVKAKLYWNLRNFSTTLGDSSNGDTINNYKDAFWDSPAELYSVSGTPFARSNASDALDYHGVQNTGASTTAYNSPYFYSEITTAGTTYTSKLEGYGIKAFYLSLPECRSTNLSGLPFTSGQNAFFSTGQSPDTAIATECNKLTHANPLYQDYYLVGLRDLAFAAIRDFQQGTNSSSTYSTKNRTALSRYLKGYMLAVNYNGLENINFKRLEGSEAAQTVLWKIPKQIIYYNKAALALSNDTSTQAVADANEFGSGFKFKVRFQGSSQFHGSATSYGNSTTTYDGMGAIFKGDAVWNEWTGRWDADAGSTTNDTRQFCEADIEWMAYNGDTANNLNINSTLRLYDFNDFFIGQAIHNSTPPNLSTKAARFFYPWHYRSLDQRGNVTGVGRDFIGAFPFNIDANTLFSTASNFIPDPVDEYVFRVVLNKNLTGAFQDTVNNKNLRSALILEHGFSEDNDNARSNVVQTTLDTVFRNYQTNLKVRRARARYDYSKFKIFVRSEHIERINGEDRIVITLVIQCPRIKSIGYSRVYRRSGIGAVYSGAYTKRELEGVNTASLDTDLDAGPWYFGDLVFRRRPAGVSGAPQFHTDNNPGNNMITYYWGGAANATNVQHEGDENWQGGMHTSLWASGQVGTVNNVVSGRNECAVKFSRVGIPSDLWIRLSVVGTDKSAALVNSNGVFISTET